jgi:peptidoglycan LD-endopeptidase LytH
VSRPGDVSRRGIVHIHAATRTHGWRRFGVRCPPQRRHVRSPLSLRRLVVLAGVLVVTVLAAPTGAFSDTLEELGERREEAEDRSASLEERIEAHTRRYDELESRIGRLEDAAADLADEIDGLRGEHDELDELMSFRVREVFKHGSALDPIAVFLASDEPSAALARAETVQRVVGSDRARAEVVAAARTQLEVAEGELADRQQDLEEARHEQSELGEQLREDFAAAQAEIEDLTEEERAERARLRREREEARAAEEAAEQQAAEQRAAEQEAAEQQSDSGSTTSAPAQTTAPSSGGGMVCPLDQPRHFIDSWGHARSGGRAHRGTDIMGPLGTPVRAITSGVWDIQRPGPSAGLWAVLRGDNGDHYWYMHLDSHTVADGTRVSAGQQVGTNGSTGNAVAGAEHVHFELHPGGGSAVNPYPLLRRVCG